MPGNLNPADLPSRGCSPKHLYESQWWEGPNWLCSPPSDWPQEQFEYNEVEIIQERKKRVVTSMINGNIDFWHLNYFHKYNKTLRMVAWIFRFINNVKSKQRSCEALTADEIIGAEKFVLKVIQTESYPDRKNESLSSLNVFEDEDGLIRLRTQVSNRKDIEDFCYPVVLPGRHSLVKLLIIIVHENSLHVRTQGLLSLLREYLGQLERAHKVRTFDRDVKIGEIVLVGNDVDKRFDWPLARVTELLPNRDGKTRLVRVLTHKGQLLRPVQRLYPLECSDVDLPEARLLPERQATPVPITEVPVPDGQVTDLTYDRDEEDQHNQCSDKTGVKSRVNRSGVKLTRSGRVSKLPVRYL